MDEAGEAHSTVQVYRTSPRTLKKDIGRVLTSPESRSLDSRKKTFVKINANYDRIWPGCNTSKWFLEALFKNLRDLGFDDIKVIEGDLKLQPATRTVQMTGIDKILALYGVEFVPIEQLDREYELPTFLRDSQLISTPVLHTHTFAVISVAAKNLYGLLPVYREKYHSILSQKLLELTERIKVFSIVDGTVGLEGGSMRMGTPIRTDLILAGWDPVAVDVIAAKIMGFSENEVPYLRQARRDERIGSIDIDGDFSQTNLPKFNFHFSESRLSNIDLWLRGNRLTGSLFDYDRTLDRLANRVRRRYTHSVYKRRRESVSVGSWREYEELGS
ncbi:MAG TPA: DUF362 domain-containing protein [Thermoplasmata archaeon]